MNLSSTNKSNSQYSIQSKEKLIDKKSHSKENSIDKANNYFFQNDFNVIQTRMFDLQDSFSSEKRIYLKQFEESRTNFTAIDVLLLNPYYKNRDLFLSGLTVWYFEDEEVGKNNFNIEIKKDWEIVEFVQSWGTPAPGFWKNGECRVEIFLENKLVCKHSFLIGNNPILEIQNDSLDSYKDLNKQTTAQPKQAEQLTQSILQANSSDSILKELNNLVGLKNLKQSLSDFINYLNFIRERKKQEINTQEIFYVNCIFLGNPGTGKTTVARMLGKFFKSIGLLENGHVVEVDRSALVGEYIGETAQKTDKVINQALGGILFIDEAYSLTRDTSGRDFGKEAIDILLKRMEDHKGKFFVIAAGYPELMTTFIESNPGLKSRFTHTFVFDDYSAEDLTEIFKVFAHKDNYNFTDDVIEILNLKLQRFCADSDESFGNARFVRNLFNESKIQLSKRYHALQYDERNFLSISTITKEDILSAFNSYNKHNSINIFNEDKLDKFLTELNCLVGLDDVKITFNKLLASIKLDQLKKERSIASISKNLNSIFVSEQGTGTTTVARLFGKMFKELSLLEDGRLVEIDNSTFFGLSKIDSYLILDKIFQDSVGKILLINDSILTLQAKSDFSDSLLQYFLKKLYLYKDKVVAILSGSIEDIEYLLTNVPVIENQFPNVYNFGNYSTRQLLEITLNICQKKNYQLEEGAWQQMMDMLSELRKDKTKSFNNARTIKKILDKAISEQEKRIISIKHPKDADLMTIKYEDFKGLLSA